MNNPNGIKPARASLETSFAALALASVVLAAGGVGLFAFSAASRALEGERAKGVEALAEAKEAVAVEIVRAHAEEASQVASLPPVRALLDAVEPPPPEPPDEAEDEEPASEPAEVAPPPRNAGSSVGQVLEAVRPATSFAAIALIGPGGELLASTHGERASALRDSARSSDRPRWSNLREDRGGRARYDLSVPVRIRGHLAGFVVAEVHADRLRKALVERARLAVVVQNDTVADELDELEVAGAALNSETEEEDERSALAEPIRHALLATIGLALLAVGASFALARTFTAPLAELADATRAYGQGDLRGAPAASQRTDELGRLSGAVATLYAGLRAFFGDLRAGIDSLDHHAEEMSSSSRKYIEAVESQASAVASTSSALVETKKSAATTAATARSVLEATEAAVEAGRRGLDRIDEGVEAVSAIEDRVRGIATEALELSEQSTRIGQIVATVNDISEQSNVLAVNASVEAAKAGDRGRGFAVVAEEVRRLAEQSKRATHQIRQILSEVQRAVESVVMAAEEGTKRSEDGRRAISEIRTTVHELASALEQNAEGARRISMSAADQSAGISQLSWALESIVDAGKSASGEMDDLKASAAALKELGAELDSLVKRYRV